jgi:para-nitrobenzyl esterase
LLKDHPRTLLANGAYNKAPLIIGTNANESRLFEERASRVNSVLAFTLYLATAYSRTWVALLPHYAPATDADAAAAFFELTDDTWFRCPARALARGAAAHGSSVYLYSFDLPPAVHTQELDYVFGLPLFGPSITSAPVPPLSALVTATQGYWTAFARTGDPGSAGATTWPKYSGTADQHLVLDSAIGVGSGLSRAGCDAWTSAYVVYD